MPGEVRRVGLHLLERGVLADGARPSRACEHVGLLGHPRRREAARRNSGIFGSVQSVSAVGSRSRTTRTVRTGERAGTRFPVEVPTHVSALATFVDGGVSQSVFSFDSPLTRMGYVEVTGTDGTMIIPDPNLFTGEVKITRAPDPAAVTEDPCWETVEVTGAYAERGLGVLDLARAARTGGRPLASGQLGFHVLDTLVAIDEAISGNRVVGVESRVEPRCPGAVRGVGCKDCVVSVLLGVPDTLLSDERQALEVLAEAGLAPRLRLVPIHRGRVADGDTGAA